MPFLFSGRASLLIAFGFVVTACRPSAPAAGDTPRDDFGRPVHFGAPPSRIASLNPTTTEILFAIGAGNRLVGRSQFDNWPDSARFVPSLGPALRPSVEAVLRAKPDLVVLYASEDNRGAADKLTQAGIPTLALRTDHIAQFRAVTRLLGRLTGDSARAENVIDTLDASLARLRAATSRLPHPTVFVPVWDNPVMTVGRGSYITELLQIAGARNVYDSMQAPSATVALEDVIRRNPDFVLTTAREVPAIEKSPTWRALPAVRAGRVLGYDEDRFERPSVRMGMAAWDVARMLHPELRPK